MICFLFLCLTLAVLVVLEMVCFDQLIAKNTYPLRSKRYLTIVCTCRDSGLHNRILLRLILTHRFILALQLLVSIVGLFIFGQRFALVFALWGTRSLYCLVVVWLVPSRHM